jgi:hypothetical protein
MDLNWIMAAAVAVQALYAALTFHRDRKAAMQDHSVRQPRRLMLVIGGFMVLTWAAVAFDYLTRPDWPQAQIINYGTDGPNQFHAVVSFPKWKDYSKYKAILIT